MDSNDRTRENQQEDVVVLGVASVDTHGGVGIDEPTGELMACGLSDE